MDMVNTDAPLVCVDKTGDLTVWEMVTGSLWYCTTMSMLSPSMFVIYPYHSGPEFYGYEVIGEL